MRLLRTFLAAALALHAAGAVPEVALRAPGGVLRLAVTGDTGEGAAAVAEGIRRVHDQQPLDGVILTGDNFYPCGVASTTDPRWGLADPLTRLGIPLFPVLGNHDYCGRAVPDAQIAATGTVPHWTFPGRTYAIRSPLADFAFIETTPFAHGQGAGPAAFIGSAFESSSATWRIVAGHHPIVSSGFHGYFPRAEVRRMRTLLPVLKQERIDVYICGHDHHLELIGGSTMFLVSGAGSDPIPPVRLHARTIFPGEIRFEPIGFAVLEIRTDRIRIRMYDGEGRARSGWMERKRR